MSTPTNHVEWVDELATVGSVRIVAYAPDCFEPWRFAFSYGSTYRYFASSGVDDEATAKELAIAVARAIPQEPTPQEPISHVEYVILDSRASVGNCGSWWAPNGKGYVCSIDEAGRYTREAAESHRDTDIPVPLDIALAYAVRHVRVDQLCRSYDLQRGRKTVEQRLEGRTPPPPPAPLAPPRQDDDIRFYRANAKPYGTFSNLFRCKVVFEGVEYPTSEHAYQAGKASKPEVRAWLLAAPTPALCAIAAHGLPSWDVVSNWAEIKLDRMRAVLRAKFEQHLELAVLLASTGDARLVEAGTTNNAVNRFWGEVNGKGFNTLGVMLMEIRTDIQLGGQGGDLIPHRVYNGRRSNDEGQQP